MKEHSAAIVSVAPRSTAARAGLRAGDRLLALNGQPLRDVIDVQVYADAADLEFLVERDGTRLTLRARRRYGQPLGLEFAEPLFDGPPRVCRNGCDFCFVAQMPPGLRRSLYLKDDDYRLSFLHGNFITLTNLSEADWQRIGEQYLSPLYVSVHATEPEVRVALLRNPHAGAILAQLRRLLALRVEVHTQAVLVPGRNDGPHLERTIADLAALYPGVRSLSVVPVGLTRWGLWGEGTTDHRPQTAQTGGRALVAGLRPYTETEAGAVLEQVLAWQARLRRELGVGFVYPSDEWYLRAGVPLPPLAAYDGALPAVIENGVGMVASFLAEWPRTQARLAALGGPRQTWVTGTLFAPVLAERAAALSAATGLIVEVVPVPNRFLGETVTVAGLLTVQDVLATLAERAPGDVIVLPAAMFRGPEGRALDDHTVAAVAAATGWRVEVSE